MKKTKIHIKDDDTYRMPLGQLSSEIRLGIEGHIPDHDLVKLLDCSYPSITIQNSKKAFEDLKEAWKNDKYIDKDLVRRAVRFFPGALGYAPNDIQDALLDDIIEDLFRKTDGARAWKVFERMVDSYISVLEIDVKHLIEQQIETDGKMNVMQSKFVEAIEADYTLQIASYIPEYKEFELKERKLRVEERKEKFPNLVIDVYLPQGSWDNQKYIERALSLTLNYYKNPTDDDYDMIDKFFHNHRVNYHKHNMSSYNILFSFSRFPSDIEKEHMQAQYVIENIFSITQARLNIIPSLKEKSRRIRLIANSPYPKQQGPVPVLTRLNSLYNQIGQLTWRETFASWGMSWLL